MDVETMKRYYKKGLWSLDMLDKLLEKQRLTKEQYEAVKR